MFVMNGLPSLLNPTAAPLSAGAACAGVGRLVATIAPAVAAPVVYKKVRRPNWSADTCCPPQRSVSKVSGGAETFRKPFARPER